MNSIHELSDHRVCGNRIPMTGPAINIPVLLVDDNRTNLRILEKLLQGEGYELVLASSGNEAFQLTLNQDFALILLDVHMPEMDGHETAALIHSNMKTRDVPIIFVTANDDAESRNRSYKAGAVDHLAKPVEPLVLRSKVEIFARLYRQRQMIEQQNIVNREKDLLLLQQDKLASIGKLAAGIAHEINNPLSFIMSNLGTLKKYAAGIRQYLKAEGKLLKNCCHEDQIKLLDELGRHLDVPYIVEEDLDTLISESLDGAERVKRIVLDLKDFARSDESGMQVIDLNTCVQSAVNIVRNEIRYVADIDLSLSPLPTVVCNPQQINLVVANLLLNAGQSIHAHGRISLSTSCQQDRIAISVADTGSGISPEVIGSIFDPFFTTKPVGQGIGLGLSISYDIITKHGGDISVVSEPGVGSTFTISLPTGDSQEVLT